MSTKFLTVLAALALFGGRSVPAGGKAPDSAPASYWALPLAPENRNGSERKILSRSGVPFLDGALLLAADGAARVNIGGTVTRIFLLGMTDSSKPRSWAHPLDYPLRYFVGDEMGRIRLEYLDGTTQVFPLILGESLWWGKTFFENPQPFPTDGRLREAFAAALRLYPPAPVADGNYLAVIAPRPSPIRWLTIEASDPKRGIPAIAGITVERAAGGGIPGALPLPGGALPPEFEKFSAERALRPLGENEAPARLRLAGLRRALYTSEGDFTGTVVREMPRGYSGPTVSFQGNISAEILTNAFHANVQDMAAKIGEDGAYHTSTKEAPSWGGYNGFGTFRKNLGKYYDQSWCRDMGRSLQELTVLGYTGEAARCADYCLRQARRWEEDPTLQVDGHFLPRHWGRIVNLPGKVGCFENDGHGLTTLFLFKLWQRLPQRDDWLRARWVDVKAAGDWILWQFDHPEISGATDVLHTTSECAAMEGSSVYADAVCRNALVGLAQMADAIGETSAAERWRQRAEMMRRAIETRYVVADPKSGRVWTLAFSGWPNQTSVLGPLIFLADDRGFAPEDDTPGWRTVNEATYRRLVDPCRPFGFYGQAMGYGQGFVTQAALLLDHMREATQMLKWAAREIYDPKIGSFIVPEGCEIDSTGRFWFRMGDLGNGVQEAEIVKALRIMIGVDDTRPSRVQFFPRMPYGWTGMTVDKYPIVFVEHGRMTTGHLRYELRRLPGDRMTLEIASDQNVGPVLARLGPFARRPNASDLRVNGKIADAAAEHSGDSWWLKVMIPVGPVVR